MKTDKKKPYVAILTPDQIAGLRNRAQGSPKRSIQSFIREGVDHVLSLYPEVPVAALDGLPEAE